MIMAPPVHLTSLQCHIKYNKKIQKVSHDSFWIKKTYKKLLLHIKYNKKIPDCYNQGRNIQVKYEMKENYFFLNLWKLLLTECMPL